ncbi:beta strand repeat-containing protein [Muricoccus radiodurans]|uniref:beta strand repeat-containing protein n=1 Tax=Muricoccus radiodurans TaxID=2231721 RepID=UPI003CEB50FC
MAGIPSVIDLALVTADSIVIRINGASVGDQSGISVSWAGDVNGDGYDEVIIGAPGADPSGRSGAGSSYVVFGHAEGFTDIDLASLTSTQGFRIDGEIAGGQSGLSVSSAGDVNGDGYADLIVGAPFAGPSGRDFAGIGYVVLGYDGGFTDLDLTDLTVAEGFRISGATADDQSGISVSSAGDLNGDGYDDLIVGAFSADPAGRVGAGSSYVLFGRADGFADIDLSGLTVAQGFRIDGAVAGDQSGFSVSSAGDVNGDGFADLIIGAPTADASGRSINGSSYVVFGQAGGFADIDLGSLTSTEGFRIDGAVSGDLSGRSVSSAGDVNGDGYDDLIVGADGADPSGRAGAGSSYVLFGHAGEGANIDLANLTAAQGFRITGAATNDQSGYSVASAGDVNGDGYDDLIVGAYGADPSGRFGAGSSYVVFGHSGGFTDVDLAHLSAGQGFRIDGAAANDLSGRSVSTAGDVNGDGYDDLIVGAPQADALGREDAGSSYLLFGEATAAVTRTAAVGGSNYGGDFNDSLSGVGGAERLFGRDGNDTLNGGAGADTMAGGVGSDVYYVDAASDLIVEASGDGVDTVYASASYTLSSLQDVEVMRVVAGTGGVSLIANGLSNQLYGGSGNDTLNAGAGADILVGNGGADSLIGGSGNDAYYVDAADSVWEAAGGGNDNVYTAVDFTLTAGQEIEFLTALAGSPGLALTGNEFHNRLTGAGGADTLAGGASGDVYYVNTSDTVIEAAGGGSDIVYAASDFSLGAGQEIEFLIANAGSTGLALTGNELSNQLWGGAGADTLAGGGGDDLYYIGAGDGVQEAAGGGNDTLFSSVNFTLGAGIEIEVLRVTLGVGGVTLTGNELANQLFGANANDVLNGGGGGDVLAGANGADTLNGGAGTDILIGGSGADTFVLANLAANRDVINDFVGGTDRLQVSASLFGGGLSAGSLAVGQFAANTTGLAGDADDRFIYNTATGALFYDANGTGAGGAVQIATLTAMPALSASDFSIVA